MIAEPDKDQEPEEIKNEEKKEENSPSQSQSGISDDVNILYGDISTKLSSVFNRLIYTINIARGNLEKEEKELKKRRNGETIDLIQLQHEEVIEKEKRKKQKRKFKDYELEYQQNRPKKPVSSFFIFYQEKLKQLGNKTTDINAPKISQIASNAWKTMTPEQKRPYLQKANETKEKYVEQMRQYIEEYADQIQMFRQEKRDALANQKKTKNFQKYDEEPDAADKRFINRKLKGISMRQLKIEQRRQYSHRPKAPVSSFFIFYQQEAKNIAEKYSVTEGKKLSKLASDIWKKMSEEEKKPFDIKAIAEREKYHEEMRQYRIKYPHQVQARKKRLSISMRRNFQKKADEGQKDSESEAIPSSELDESQSYESVRSQKQQEPASKKDQQQQIQKEKPEKQKVPSTRKANDLLPHKPRGPTTGFFQFYQKHMKQFFIAEKGQNHGSDLVRRASQKWKQLTDEEKKPFGQMFRLDRERYKRQMQEYKVKYPEEYEIYVKVIKNKIPLNAEDRIDEIPAEIQKESSGLAVSANVQTMKIEEYPRQQINQDDHHSEV